MGDTTPNREGRSLIDDWERTTAHRRQLELQIVDARNAERRATKALAAWLAPKDAKPGETFGIWERDRHNSEALYLVTFGGSVDVDPVIEKRNR